MNYFYRFGCLDDAARLSALHYACRAELVDSFMCSLGRGFLRAYYQAVLQSPYSYVICMVDEKGTVQGFTVSAFDAKAHFAAVGRRNIRMFLAATPALFIRPWLILGILLRRKVMAGQEADNSFISLDGARNEFMALDVTARNGPQAMILMRRTLDVSKAMGVRALWIEVDEANTRAMQFHLRLGAQVVRSIARPDGKKRNLMLYKIVRS